MTLRHAVGTCSDTGSLGMELDLAHGASSLNCWRIVTLMTLQQESGRHVVHEYSDTSITVISFPGVVFLLSYSQIFERFN